MSSCTRQTDSLQSSQQRAWQPNADAVTPVPLAVYGSNHHGMRQFNERTILQALRLHGPTPKAELARLTRLSKQTVGTIVDRLVAEGLLIKQARIRGGIGQPSVPLALNPDGAFGIGVQVGRRSLEVLVADFVGQVRYRHSLQYEAPDPQRLLPHIEQELRGVRRRWAAHWPRVSGVGLAAPRDMHLWAEVLGPAAAPVLARWQGVDLLATVQRMVDVPVVLARDTLAACAAELWQGHGQTCANFFYIFVGTFVGGGVVLGGHVMGGLHGNAGAIGSMPLGRAEHAEAAQLLEVASVWSLERALLQRGWDSQRVLGGSELPAQVADVVQPWLLQAGDALAMTVTTAAAMLDVDAVIIDASVPPALLQALVSSVQSQMGRYHWWGLRQPRVMPGKVGRHARALGGALLPLHAAFFPDRAVFLKPQE